MRRRTFVKLLALLGLAPRVGAQTAHKMTHDNYCVNVCGGKCCKYMKVGDGFVNARCPALTDCNRCSKFSEWKDGSCGHSYPVQIGGKTYLAQTAPIEYAIKNKLIPEWIEKQCCYAHPELLEV